MRLLLHFLLPIFRPVGEMSGFSSMSKSVCADSEDDSSSVLRYMDAAMRRGKGCVYSSAKINLLFRIDDVFAK